MIAEKLIRFVIAASVALGIMCFQTWWRIDITESTYSIRGLSGDSLTRIDGYLVLGVAGVALVAAIVGLIHRQWLSLCSATIAAAGMLGLVVTVYGLIEPPSRHSPLLTYITVFVNYHPTPLLYFSAVTCLLIAAAGVVLAVAGEHRTEPKERSAEAWA
ncbi:MAG: hypothetical protein ABI559_08605 [Chloroflexota bacterium]